MATNKKIAVISLFCGIITISLVIFIVFPLLRGIKNYSQDVISAKESLDIIQSRIDKINSAGVLYHSMEEDLKKIESFFIDPSTPIGLIKFWERLALETDVSIDISPVSSRNPETDVWDRVGFQMRADGSYVSFLRFLEKIENGPYLMEIKNLSLNKAFGSSKPGNEEINAAIDLNVFAKKK